MIRRILRAYLSLTRGERNGFFILILLIMTLLLGRIFIPGMVHPSVPDFKTAEQDFRAFREVLQDAEAHDPVATGHSGYSRYPASPRYRASPRYPVHPEHPGTEAAIQYFDFDPNNISYKELLQLGLSLKVSRTMLNYRNSGGVFYDKTDLLKVYGLSEADYIRLEPYISIATIPAYPRKKTEVSTFDLNSTDSSRLQVIYGIGPVFANRIIRYRDLLGGFCKQEQLMEVYGLKEQQYDEIIRHVFIDTSCLRKINLNTAERKILSGHPYLNAYQADAIIAYRDFRGGLQNIDEIVHNELLPDSVFARIRPYFEIDR